MSEHRYHHGNLRSELLEHATLTVREQGVDQLSLRDLARRAGVSHSAPRRHFQDRQALLNALAQDGFRRLGTELRRAFESAGPDFSERLRAVARAYLRFAIEDAALLDLMFTSKGQDPQGPLHDAAMSAFEPVLGMIEQGQSDGALESGDCERIGLVLFASIQGTAALLSARMVEPEQLEQLTGDVLTYFLRGARPGGRTMSV